MVAGRNRNIRTGLNPTTATSRSSCRESSRRPRLAPCRGAPSTIRDHCEVWSRPNGESGLKNAKGHGRTPVNMVLLRAFFPGDQAKGECKLSCVIVVVRAGQGSRTPNLTSPTQRASGAVKKRQRWTAAERGLSCTARAARPLFCCASGYASMQVVKCFTILSCNWQTRLLRGPLRNRRVGCEEMASAATL